MEETYEKNAYSQAYAIVNFLVEEGEMIISQELLEVLESRRNINYEFDLNDIANIQLHPDAEKILTVVFWDFIANEEEKNNINNAISMLKKVIMDEGEEFAENESLPLDLNSLKWSERVKLKMRKLFSINSRNAGLEGNSRNGYQK